jgi:hypothetical protein
MSKTLDKLEKQCAVIRKQITEHKTTCPKSKNWALEYNCPKCKALVGVHCKSPSGHITTYGHKERTQLSVNDVTEYNKISNDWQIKLNSLSNELNSLLDKQQDLDIQEKKVLAIKKFKDSFKGIKKLSNAELVLEVGRDNDFLVIKSHNIAQLVPGDRLPSREVLPMLAKKGVDIMMTKPQSYFEYGPSWYWQTPRW